MRFGEFLKDRILMLVLQGVCMVGLYGFLRFTGYSRGNGMLILIVWILILGVYLFISYVGRNRYFKEMKAILKHTDKRYLLGELMPDSWRQEDKIYRELIRKSNKSVIEEIRQVQERQEEYKEYIESWVHEIKAPITGISLICENGRNHENFAGRSFRKIITENQKIENYVDMVLYYARSEDVYKDYMIQKIHLKEAVFEVLEKNRFLLIENGIRAEVVCEDFAYTDRKWLVFILNQMVLNSVKYKNEEAPVFRIFSEKRKNGTALVLSDNGTGIKKEELSRIFEKGFTGTNGRTHERSTGMGLYLCKKLCKRLGIGISASSIYGQGTEICLEFPISTYIAREDA